MLLSSRDRVLGQIPDFQVLFSGLAVVGELGSDDAYIFWLLLLMVLHLPLAICISLMFACLSDYMELDSFISGLLQVSR